jgi:glycine dehydrogenase subunit 1
LIIQTPNFLGALEHIDPLCERAHAVGALVVAVCPEPLAFALVEPPGKAGADMVVGEGIGLASEPNLGGPGVGLFGASGKKALRQLPGRVVGQTVDQAGRPGYVLTLATREQHIRRDKATSNICTNHGLWALRFTIHMALLGPRGLRELAEINLAKAVYARDTLCAAAGFEQRFTAPFFNEVAIRVPGGDAERLADMLVHDGIVAGVPMGRFAPEYRDTLLVALNETHERAQIDRLARALAQAASRLD